MKTSLDTNLSEYTKMPIATFNYCPMALELFDHGIEPGRVGATIEKGISLETPCPEFSSVMAARRI